MNSRWHEEFLSLCALYPDKLTEEEWLLLQIHLAYCDSCLAAFRQFERLASELSPAIVADTSVGSDQGEDCETYSVLIERAERRLMRYIDHGAGWLVGITRARAAFLFPLGILATCVLCIAGGFGLGLRRSSALSHTYFAPNQATDASAISPSHLPQLSKQASGYDDSRATELESEIEKLRKAYQRSNSRNENLEDELALEQERHAAADQQRDSTNQVLAFERSDNQSLHDRLSVMTAGLDEQRRRSIALEAQLNEADSKAKEREEALANETELLAHDHEIRDLIGARDLYVADINDLGADGKATKPFGRIFYTKNRSLVFYGYDLDKQSGLSRSVAFQAWGKVDGIHEVSLGMFYQDESHKRWMLKFDDANTLARLNMVFVTAEPLGGSRKPTGKPLLMAYLQMEPNHP